MNNLKYIVYEISVSSASISGCKTFRPATQWPETQERNANEGTDIFEVSCSAGSTC